jgi:hypothetical protein
MLLAGVAQIPPTTSTAGARQGCNAPRLGLRHLGIEQPLHPAAAWQLQLLCTISGRPSGTPPFFFRPLFHFCLQGEQIRHRLGPCMSCPPQMARSRQHGQ